MAPSKLIKNVGKQFAIYGLGDLLNKAIAFMLLPVYTHYLHPQEYGVMEMLDLTMYLVSMFLTLGIPAAVVRFYYKQNDETHRRSVVSSGLMAAAIVSLLALIPLLPLSSAISGLTLKSPEFAHFFRLVFIAMAFNQMGEIVMVYFRVREMPIWFISFSTTRLLFSLTGNILFLVYLKKGVEGVLWSGLISSTLVNGVLIGYGIRQVGVKFSWATFRPMLAYGAPLVGSGIGMYLINFGDRFALQRLMTLGDVGIYSLAYKFGMLPNVLLLTPFHMLWEPKQFQIAHEPDAPDVFSRVFNYFWFLQMFLALGLCVLIRDVIHVIAAPEYGNASVYVPLLILSYVCFGAYTYFQFGVMYARKTTLLAINTLVMAFLNVGLNFLLIPRMGVLGACVATFTSIFLMMVVIYFLSRSYYPISFAFGKLVMMTVIAAGLYLVAARVNPGNIALSIAVKTLIALSYPVPLIVFRVTRGEELNFLRDYRDRFFRGIFGGRTGA